LRYRGSVIGPFWITLSTTITVYSMGFLYGTLFGLDRATYLPYFTTGIITWNFISMIINESTKIFLESKPYMENIRLPCIVYMFRLVLRNAIIWAHNLPVYLSIAFLYHMQINLYTLLIIPGLLLFCLNAVFYGTIVSLLSARYPDIGSIVSSFLQVIFFVTPIMWVPSALPSHLHIYIKLNPFSYFVSLMRNPLLGLPFSGDDLIAVGILTFIGLFFFVLLVKRYSKRVVFWL
jgi:ABC-type polysaccharide/polyol phosphate export permease